MNMFARILKQLLHHLCKTIGMSKTLIICLFIASGLAVAARAFHPPASNLERLDSNRRTKEVGLDLCPWCIDEAVADINVLLNLILDEGILGSCGDLCGALANRTGSAFAGDICEVVCDGLGIDEFIREIIKIDLDPIWYCEIADLCPINDKGDAKFVNFGVQPSTGPQWNGYSNGEIANSVKKELESLNSELALVKEDVANAQEREKIALSKAKNLNDEISSLKNEVKFASEAEEKSRKAMDDLALALKEVATEASEAKEKLGATELELEQVKEEEGKLKEMIRSTEARYQKLLDEAKKEADLYRNTTERLRLENEESLLAWNGKEMGFISCIKRADEERALAQRETERLTESLKAAEATSEAANEEKFKLRDILKQAINEANAAKAAAGLARDENSQLKDRLTEKEEALHFITKDNERLRTNGPAASHDNVKVPSEMVEDHEGHHKAKTTFKIDLTELKIEKPEDFQDETLKGSIFDPTSVTPKSQPRTPRNLSQCRRASAPDLADEAGKPNANPDYNHLDDSDSDRNLSSRRKALFRKVGDLIMKKSFHV